jgi:hypothetical protein
LLVFILLSPLIYFFQEEHTNDVSSVSINNFKNKTVEREEYFHDFFYPYMTSISSLSKNPILLRYIDSKEGEDIIKDLFVQLKQSLPCSTQVRMLDIKGKELIRVDGTPIGLRKDKAITNIASQDKLQDKSKSYYFKEFIELPKGKVGF